MDISKRRERLLMKIAAKGAEGLKIHRTTETDNSQKDSEYLHEKQIVFLADMGVHLRAVHSVYLREFYASRFLGMKPENLKARLAKARAATRLGMHLEPEDREEILEAQIIALQKNMKDVEEFKIKDKAEIAARKAAFAASQAGSQ